MGERDVGQSVGPTSDPERPRGSDGTIEDRGPAGEPVQTVRMGDVEPLVQGDVEKGPLISVRLGLSLLAHRDSGADERAVDRAADRVADRTSGRWRSAPPFDERGTADVFTRSATPRAERPIASVMDWLAGPTGARSKREVDDTLRVTATGAELEGRGWGAARLVADQTREPRHEGAGVRVAALLCVAAAAMSATMGYGVLAIALGLGAAWLGLRRSGATANRYDNRDGLRDD